jgi:hypothetical protein
MKDGAHRGFERAPVASKMVSRDIIHRVCNGVGSMQEGQRVREYIDWLELPRGAVETSAGAQMLSQLCAMSRSGVHVRKPDGVCVHCGGRPDAWLVVDGDGWRYLAGGEGDARARLEGHPERALYPLYRSARETTAPPSPWIACADRMPAYADGKGRDMSVLGWLTDVPGDWSLAGACSVSYFNIEGWVKEDKCRFWTHLPDGPALKASAPPSFDANGSDV